MKRLLGSLVVFMFILTGCGGGGSELNVMFVPSAPAEEIMAATEPLEEMLKEELAKSDITIDKVNVTVGTTYEAVGESVAAGTTDIALIPGGTFVLYEEDGAEIALTSTRSGLSIDSDDAKAWNDQKPTESTDEQVDFYRSLVVAGPSEYGRELADKVNNGKELTYEDIDKANVCLQSASSSAGYLYPQLVLSNAFDKSIADLSSTVQVKGYPDALSRLAAGQCDIAPMYADARQDNVDKWSEMGGENDIWEDTDVIAVTPKIFNDTVTVSKNSDMYKDNPEFNKAVQEAFMNIASTEEGLKTVEPYSHEGYMEGDSANYEDERDLQKMQSEK